MSFITTKLPPVEYLLECFEITENWELIWKTRPSSHFSPGKRSSRGKANIFNAMNAGKIAGHIDQHTPDRKYRRVSLDGKRYRAHRIIFFVRYGVEPIEIDHRDCDGLNNDPDNLRDCDRKLNALNIRIKHSNRSGLKGVLTRKDGRFSAQIGRDDKTYYLGLYGTPEEAHAAYVGASKILHGEFGREQ